MQSRKGWSEIEDDRLLKIIKKYGIKNWTLISQKLSLGSTQQRTGKQCRQRWHNNLNPSINNKEWTNEEDQVLFQAHRQHGSKWKQISKLFEGRTDNSIKNHFYSTVRSCLRKIAQFKGEPNNATNMKSIKPFVLSKIVENSELTNLILSIGRNKSRSNRQELQVNETTINHINQQLKRISIEYDNNKRKGKVEEQSPQSSMQSFQSQQFIEGEMKELSIGQQKQTLKMYSQIAYFAQNEDDPVEQTNQQQKSKESLLPKFKSFQEQLLHPTADKNHKVSLPQQDQIWVQQSAQHNFFNSPAYQHHQLPCLKLPSKVSRNSQSEGQERRRHNLLMRMQQQQGIEIEFDPQELVNSD